VNTSVGLDPFDHTHDFPLRADAKPDGMLLRHRVMDSGGQPITEIHGVSASRTSARTDASSVGLARRKAFVFIPEPPHRGPIDQANSASPDVS
jgi:hypothetical protein